MSNEQIAFTIGLTIVFCAVVFGLYWFLKFLIDRKPKAITGPVEAGINLSNAAVDNEMRVGVLERVVETLIHHSDQEAIKNIDIGKIQDEALKDLQKRYPKCGIELVKKEK